MRNAVLIRLTPVVLVVLGSFLLALALTPTLAQTGSNSPLAQYDANENGKVDEAEFAQAVQDYKAGTIDRATMATVAGLYLSTLGVIGQGVSCGEYDFNGDGGVDANEQEAAIGEWEAGIITSAQLAVVLSCPPPRPPPPPPGPTDTPTPTPTHTPTPTPTDTPTPTPEPPTPTPTPLPPSLGRPPVPAGVHNVSSTNTGFTVGWTSVKGVAHTTVELSTGDKNIVWRERARGSGTNNTAEVTGLSACTSYEYTLRAYGDNKDYAQVYSFRTSVFTVLTAGCPPVITTGPSAVTYVGGSTVSIGTFAAMDLNEDTVSWSVGGTDGSLFRISSGGVLRFRASPDHGNPRDSGRNNVYNVNVVATDNGSPPLSSDPWSVTVTVTSPDDPPVPPAPTGLTATATGPTTVDLQWDSKSGIAKYEVQWRLGATGSWTTVSSNVKGTSYTVTGLTSNMTYRFQVRAYGNGDDYAARWGSEYATASATTLVSPPPVPPPPPPTVPDQPGVVTLSDTTPQVGTAITATLADLDGGIVNVTWQWQRLVTGWGDITGATGHSYTPMSADVGRRLRVVAFYDDSHRTKRSAVSATPDAVAVPPPPMPTGLTATAAGPTTIDLTWNSPISIVRHEVQRREGPAGPWVTVSANVQGRSHTVTGLTPNTEYSFSVRAYGDGTTFADTWGSYSLLDTATTLLPAPAGLRANGNLIDDNRDGVKDKVTLRWNPVQGATSYNVQYVEEICTPMMRCEPDGGLTSPNWKMPSSAVITSDSGGPKARLGGLSTNILYRVEVQAVNVRNEGSAWSAPAFVYPTGGPLTTTTNIALMDIRDFQADGQDAGTYRYTICLDDPMTVSNPMNPAISGAWTVTDVIAEIKLATKTWETAVGDSSILSMTADPETSPANCEDPSMSSTRNQVIFVDDSQMHAVCPQRMPGAIALGCWKNLGGDLSRGEAFDKQSILLRASGGNRDWDTMTNGCSRLRTVVAHEVGHALGIGHPKIEFGVRKMYLMYESFHGLCRPQPYDVVAATANYQSR